VGDAEAGAERVAGDRLPVLVLVLGDGPARGGEERSSPPSCASSPVSCTGGRRSRRGRLTHSAVLAGDAAGATGRA
jgi:hypothetical protein